MAEIAILIDGSEEPVRGGRVDFPVGAVSAPRRPLAGLGIALVTAALAMGAPGPRAEAPPEPAAAVAAACRAATPAGDGIAQATAGPTVRAATTTWWLDAAPVRYVDPATGLTVQVDARATMAPDAPVGVPERRATVDHRDRVR